MGHHYPRLHAVRAAAKPLTCQTRFVALRRALRGGPSRAASRHASAGPLDAPGRLDTQLDEALLNLRPQRANRFFAADGHPLFGVIGRVGQRILHPAGQVGQQRIIFKKRVYGLPLQLRDVPRGEMLAYHDVDCLFNRRPLPVVPRANDQQQFVGVIPRSQAGDVHDMVDWRSIVPVVSGRLHSQQV